MTKADIRIKVFAPLEVRAKRIAERDGMGLEEAMKHVKARDDDNRKRYMKLYNIDIYDDSGFDACVNAGIYRPEQLLEIVRSIIETKGC